MKQEKENIDWTRALSQRVRQAEHPVPEATWEAISRRVGNKKVAPATVQAHGKAMASSRRWLWAVVAAAAVVAAIAFLPSLFAPQEPGRHTPGAAQPTAAASKPAATMQRATQRPWVSEQEPLAAATASARPTQADHSHAAMPPSVPLAHDTAARVTPVVAPDSQAVAPVAPNYAQSEAATQRDTTAAAQGSMPLVAQQGAPSSTSSQSYTGFKGYTASNDAAGGYTASLYGTGILFAGDGGVGRNYLMSNSSSIAYNSALLAMSAAPSYDYKHKIPITVGITVGKMLDYNLEPTIGFNYSSYSSDVTNRLSGETLDQRVQLLGIPVGLKWHFLNIGHFSAYVGAEGMAERVVSARFGNDKLTVRRLQWSVDGSLGAQYAIAHHVALFLEPKFTHYFTRLPVKTLRNEHDITVNVRMGLSFDF